MHTRARDKLGLIGKAIGLKTIVNWQVTKVGYRTEVEVWKSFSGIRMKLMQKRLELLLPVTIKEELNGLKNICELN